MKKRSFTACLLVLVLLCSPLRAGPVLGMRTVDAWNTYIALTEKRVDAELKNPVVPLRSDLAYLKTGKIYVQPLETRDAKGKEVDVPDGTIHHWLGAVFIPGVTLDKLVPKLQNYDRYMDYFKGVEKSSLVRTNNNEFDISLRLTQTAFGVTVHFNTTHHVVYNPRRDGFLSSVSRSKTIRQVKNAGSSRESEYPLGDDSGYLWRLNSYWRYTERDNGVVVECETIGLSRSLGFGLGLLNIMMLGTVKSKAESIARDALTDTLKDLSNYARDGARKTAR